jgi:hypothetical protein
VPHVTQNATFSVATVFTFRSFEFISGWDVNGFNTPTCPCIHVRCAKGHLSIISLQPISGAVACTVPFTQDAPMTIVKDLDRKRALVLRLKRVEGQLRGIQRLIDEDEDCEKIAQQLAAARKALDKSFYSLVGCVIAQGDVPADDVAEMLTKFS